jgi:hypothetical protein
VLVSEVGKWVDKCTALLGATKVNQTVLAGDELQQSGVGSPGSVVAFRLVNSAGEQKLPEILSGIAFAQLLFAGWANTEFPTKTPRKKQTKPNKVWIRINLVKGRSIIFAYPGATG